MIANAHKRIDYSPLQPTRRKAAGDGVGVPDDWRVWLHDRFPSYTRAPFADRHVQLWEWLWGIARGTRPPPFVAIWPRGGAKSTSAELGCVAVAARKSRRYVLYVSETQEQADKHVQTVAGLLERAGFDRELNKYGSSKGWRRNQVRTSDGFKVDAIGLDTAARGAKIDEDRPDLIIFDDIDAKHDTPQATQKKIETLTMTILPAMATDGAVLGVQNIIHGNGIFARLADGRADFLSDRIVSGPYPAITGLDYAYQDGHYVITKGTATWEGQSIEDCQGFVKTWGLLAFLVECQHDVARAGRYYETWNDAIHVVPQRPIPGDATVWAAFDYGFAHNTAFGVFATVDGVVYLIGEHVQHKWTVKQHAPAMDGLLHRLGIPKTRLREIVAGHDAFDGSKDSSGKSIADQYAEYGYVMTHATIDRINGWSRLREGLGIPRLGDMPMFYVFDTCPITAAQIKALVHDPKRPEDVLKVDADTDGSGGDDAADMCRYGLMVDIVPARGFYRPYSERPTARRRG